MHENAYSMAVFERVVQSSVVSALYYSSIPIPTKISSNLFERQNLVQRFGNIERAFVGSIRVKL